jgi:hypothetical protein
MFIPDPESGSATLVYRFWMRIRFPYSQRESASGSRRVERILIYTGQTGPLYLRNILDTFIFCINNKKCMD